MRRLVIAAAALALVLITGAANAQSRWSMEGSAGAAFPMARIGGAELDAGFGFGVNVRYRFMPHLAAYSGWEWNHLSAESLTPGDKVDVEDTGYTFGLRFEHPLAGRMAYWLRAGGIANHIELENTTGDIVGDTGHGLGWELGGGLTLPLTQRLAVTPGVRYRSLSRDLDMGGATMKAGLRYVTVGSGLVLTF